MPSTVVAHFTYNPGTRSLVVRYTSGVVYEYKDVPSEIHEQLRGAFSKGQFLNAKIKGRYPYEKKQ